MHHLLNDASKSTNVIYHSAIVMRKSGKVMRKFRKGVDGLLKIECVFENLIWRWLNFIRVGLNLRCLLISPVHTSLYGNYPGLVFPDE